MVPARAEVGAAFMDGELDDNSEPPMRSVILFMSKEVIMAEQNRPENTEQVNGVDHRLFDGYDGSTREPSDDYIAYLLASAPEAVRARIAEAAKETAERKK